MGQPDTEYLAIPEVSSSARDYIPMAVLPPDVVASNQLKIIPGASVLYFGILTSTMHIAWMRTIGGRLKNDYRYAPSVYNSFPWPDLTERGRQQVVEHAQAVLDVRNAYPDNTLEDLYDPDAMPPRLAQAHADLDRLVDRLYRRQGFRFERERAEHLFERYEHDIASLLSSGRQQTRPGRRRGGSNSRQAAE